MPERLRAALTSRRVHGGVTELEFEVPDWFEARPGQFVHVCCGGGERILRRPYSLFNLEGNTASLLVKVVGGGSAWLARREVGESIDLLGPLGRGFSLAGEGACTLVAGGTGIASLRFLWRRLQASGAEVRVYWGMEKGGDFGDLPALLGGETGLSACSMDGEMRFKGTVTEFLRSEGWGGEGAVYACGPGGMLAELAEAIGAREKGLFQVSLEERMACGVGACRGCAVPAAGGGYLRACSDGPVFYGRELDWERMRW